MKALFTSESLCASAAPAPRETAAAGALDGMFSAYFSLSPPPDGVAAAGREQDSLSIELTQTAAPFVPPKIASTGDLSAFFGAMASIEPPKPTASRFAAMANPSDIPIDPRPGQPADNIQVAAQEPAPPEPESAQPGGWVPPAALVAGFAPVSNLQNDPTVNAPVLAASAAGAASGALPAAPLPATATLGPSLQPLLPQTPRPAANPGPQVDASKSPQLPLTAEPPQALVTTPQRASAAPVLAGTGVDAPILVPVETAKASMVAAVVPMRPPHAEAELATDIPNGTIEPPKRGAEVQALTASDYKSWQDAAPAQAASKLEFGAAPANGKKPPYAENVAGLTTLSPTGLRAPKAPVTPATSPHPDLQADSNLRSGADAIPAPSGPQPAPISASAAASDVAQQFANTTLGALNRPPEARDSDALQQVSATIAAVSPTTPQHAPAFSAPAAILAQVPGPDTRPTHAQTDRAPKSAVPHPSPRTGAKDTARGAAPAPQSSQSAIEGLLARDEATAGDPLPLADSSQQPISRSTSDRSSLGGAAAATAQAAEFGATVIRQIAHAVTAGGENAVELSLAPEELGRVRLTLTTSEVGVTVSVQAERPETLDLIRRNIDHLARDFRDLGYASINFSFGDRPQDRGQPVAQPSAFESPGEPGQTAPRKTPDIALPPAPSALGGLDLRL